MRPRLPATALALAACLAGCGAGGGDDGPVRVLVTRGFGAETIAARLVQDPAGAPSAAALLRRLGLPPRGGRPFVNGIAEDPAEPAGVHGGDRVWLDRHAAAAPAVAAVVGAYPEPFRHGVGGKRLPVVLECADGHARACESVAARLRADGVLALRRTPGTSAGEQTLRLLLGTWHQLRGDPALAQLDRGPAASGVFARFTHGGRALALLDRAGRAKRTLGAGAGLLAATRFERQAPTWAVTGTDAAGVAAAAAALGERRLHGRFALALDGARALALPLAG